MSAQIGSRFSALALSGLLGLGSAIAGCTATPEDSAETMPDAEIVTL